MKKFVLVCLMTLVGALSFATPKIVKSEFIVENKGYTSLNKVVDEINLYEQDYIEVSFDDWVKAEERLNSKNRGFPMIFFNNENETAIYEARWTNQYILVKVFYIRDDTKNLREMYGY